MSGQYLDDLKKIILQHLDNYKAKIYLFGSFARGEAKASSDVDIAIIPLESLPNDVLVELRNKIEESTIPYYVDIVDFSIADEKLKQQILAEGILWRD